MQIQTFTVGPFAENTYLLVEGKEALLIDPGFHEPGEFETVLQQLNRQEAELRAVVLTHAHVDHVLGLNRVLDRFDIPVYLSDKDRNLWDNFANQARMFGIEAADLKGDPEPLPITDRWELGAFEFEVRFTPGHSPDHVVLYSGEEGSLIAGDTLFRQGIGRYDLYKGDFGTLERSIREQIYTLPDSTEVFPGHGPKTTVGYEKKNNPFVKG